MVKQDLFAENRQDWLSKARHAAEKIALAAGKVDIEDVLAICPRPKYLHKNITGKVFAPDMFRVRGFKKSRRAISKGRIICEWELREAYYPVNTFVPEPAVREYGDSY